MGSEAWQSHTMQSGPVLFAIASLLSMTCSQKKLFVILNAVKDLLFAMLLRHAQSANRSFVPQDDKPFKPSFSFQYSQIVKLAMTSVVYFAFLI
jgi:hypothetical protein